MIKYTANFPEEDPDEIDKAMIEEAARENDGSTVSLESFTKQEK